MCVFFGCLGLFLASFGLFFAISSRFLRPSFLSVGFLNTGGGGVVVAIYEATYPKPAPGVGGVVVAGLRVSGRPSAFARGRTAGRPPLAPRADEKAKRIGESAPKQR